MSKETFNNQLDSKGGPTAPKDPVEKRYGFYIMLDMIIEASARYNRKPSQEVYLVKAQLINKAKLTGGVTDENILKHLESCEGFHKLVHSIGVSVRAKNGYTGNINFVFQNTSKSKVDGAGTQLRVPCPTDGTELLIRLKDYEWSTDDDVLGQIAFEFDNVGEMAVASVKFYLNDGFEVPEISIEPPVEFSSEAYKGMIAKSLLSKGNNMRLKAAMQKAENGEDVTIAYIGGSITQGAGSKPINTSCYAYRSYLKFKEMFGKDGGENIHFVKAGVGGTPSELGMIRYERDILRYGTVEPDIVIVEFAVNDEGDETNGVCYESLCLKALAGSKKPAVILLFSVFVNDWNLQDRLAPIGKHYDLPMVSVKDAVVEQFTLTKEEGNIISKRQYFYDIYHPTTDGHKIMADCLAYLFSEIKKADTDKKDIDTNKAPLLGDDFINVHLLDRKDNNGVAVITEGSFTETDTELQCVEMDLNVSGTPQFPNNWMHSVKKGNESFKMAIRSRSLVLVYKDSGNSTFGKADILLDGKHIKTEDPHVNNWTHCNPVILYQDKECSEHTVEIKMAAGDEDKCFTILGFGYTL